jgi:hypothetical protein
MGFLLSDHSERVSNAQEFALWLGISLFGEYLIFFKDFFAKG